MSLSGDQHEIGHNADLEDEAAKAPLGQTMRGRLNDHPVRSETFHPGKKGLQDKRPWGGLAVGPGDRNERHRPRRVSSQASGDSRADLEGESGQTPSLPLIETVAPFEFLP